MSTFKEEKIDTRSSLIDELLCTERIKYSGEQKQTWHEKDIQHGKRNKGL